MAREVFFVLRGQQNGERGVYARDCGGVKLSDGWYYLDNEGEHAGPFDNREDVQEEANKPHLEDLDAGEVVTALLSGKLAPMTDVRRMAYADAPPFTLIGEVGSFEVLVSFDDDGSVTCQAFLGDEGAEVNLLEKKLVATLIFRLTTTGDKSNLYLSPVDGA